MEEADVLLLPWKDRFNIPGKVFKYLATGKPILAICYPESEVFRGLWMKPPRVGA